LYFEKYAYLSYGKPNDLRSNLLATSNGGDIFIWDLQTSGILDKINGIPIGNEIDYFTFNADSNRFITSSSIDINNRFNPSYKISIWNIKTDQYLGEIIPKTKNLQELHSTPNNDEIIAIDDSGINVWNIETKEKLSTLPNGEFAFNSTGNDIWIATKVGDKYQALVEYNYSTGFEIDKLPTLPYHIKNIEINEENSKMLISYFLPNKIKEGYAVFDLQTKQLLWSKEIGFTNNELVVSHNG
jgi:WD40 repeat protein